MKKISDKNIYIDKKIIANTNMADADKNKINKKSDNLSDVLSDIEDNGEDNKESGKRKYKKPIIITMMIICILALAVTYSWYLYSRDNHADSKDVQIMTPYFLYLLNPDDKNSLQLSVGNIHPGEVKQVVFCVSNKKPDDVTDSSIDIARESKFNYDLEFIYTQNLLVNYDIYELQKSDYTDESDIPDDGIVVEGIDSVYWQKMKNDDETTAKPLKFTKDETAARLNELFRDDTSGIFNKGKYLLYQKDTNGNPLGLEYKNINGVHKYEYDYYLLEISWQEGVDFSKYTKETDLVYVVVNAKQPEPVEK